MTIDTDARDAAMTDASQDTNDTTTDAVTPATQAPPVDIDRAVEAILMIADEPQSLVSLATALRRPVKAVHEAINRLVADYDGLDGTVRAHGANPKMIGKNLMEIRDVDGKFFVKERVEMAKKKQPFWQDYKFTNPTSGKIEPKTMYCVPEDDMVMCGGVYLK